MKDSYCDKLSLGDSCARIILEEQGESLSVRLIADATFSAQLTVDECRLCLDAMKVGVANGRRFHPNGLRGRSLDVDFGGWSVDHHLLYRMSEEDRTIVTAFIRRFVRKYSPETLVAYRFRPVEEETGEYDIALLASAEGTTNEVYRFGLPQKTLRAAQTIADRFNQSAETMDSQIAEGLASMGADPMEA